MLKHMMMFAAVAGMVFAAAPAAHADYSTGFEPGEDPPAYVAGYDNLVPQAGWDTQFGGLWHVQPYSDGSLPWSPQSAAGEPPVSFWSPPAHPAGGLQYAGKGTNFAGGSGGGRAWHYAEQDGPIVNVDVDVCNGPEHDYPNYQSSIVSRGNWSGSGPGNSVGIYTSVASTYVNPGAPPRAGDWAFNVMAFDKFGTQIAGTLGPFYRFDELEGFDELPRETWFRIGYSYDLTTRRITQFRSDNLMDALPGWTFDDPQAMWDYPDDDPDEGPQLVDMYIIGGSPTDGNPDLNTVMLDAVGLYNVGNGQVHAFDNLTVTNGSGGPDPDPMPGDANDSGFVDDDDLAVLLSNWEQDPGTITTWALGDFTKDTDVDDDDLAVLLGNWTGSPPGGAGVPEPVSAVLLLIGAPLAAVRRRRK